MVGRENGKCEVEEEMGVAGWGWGGGEKKH